MNLWWLRTGLLPSRVLAGSPVFRQDATWPWLEAWSVGLRGYVRGHWGAREGPVSLASLITGGIQGMARTPGARCGHSLRSKYFARVSSHRESSERPCEVGTMF